MLQLNPTSLVRLLPLLSRWRRRGAQAGLPPAWWRGRPAQAAPSLGPLSPSPRLLSAQLPRRLKIYMIGSACETAELIVVRAMGWGPSGDKSWSYIEQSTASKN